MHAPKRVFISYSHKDDSFREELETHLAGLKRTNLIAPWTDRAIEVGEDWDKAISDNLENADIILFLVSAAFMSSEYIWGVEVKRAMERQQAGTARVIPIIVRPCEWQSAPFAKLQALPRDAKAVTKWADRDEAWTQVVQGIRSVVAVPPARPAAAAPNAGVASPGQALPDDLLFELQTAVINAGLVGSRGALLAGLDPTFVASLPGAPNPAAQLRTDLVELNRAVLADGTRPIRVWLRNADQLAGPRIEARTFRRALAALD